MEIFKGENLVEFTERFKTDTDCKEYLASIKWSEGYTCKRCKHNKGTIRKDFSRCCTRCKTVESPTAKTLFHKVKFGIRKAFLIVFEMTASTKGLSDSQLAKRYGISRPTAWLFTKKVRIAMKSTEQNPMVGDVHVDEFVVGGKEVSKQGRSYSTKKAKAVCAIELTKSKGVKRVYIQTIPDYSSKSLKRIFETHISKKAEVVTDQWVGYKPLSKNYDITQLKSDGGKNFIQMHTIIHQVKSWIRTTFASVDKGHIQKYFDEYCFRINRSIYKESIFHKLIERGINSPHIGYQQIKLSS
jgi:DNA-binding transcriptional regulator GbsR (MarR family)